MDDKNNKLSASRFKTVMKETHVFSSIKQNLSSRHFYLKCITWLLPYLFFYAFICFIFDIRIFGPGFPSKDNASWNYPLRIYLSNCISNGYFPLWDPYGTPGFPWLIQLTTASFNPLVLLFSIFFRYDISIFVSELMFTGFMGMVGVYLWLRNYKVTMPLAMGGAVAYAGCATSITSLLVMTNFYVSIQCIPWLFLSLNLIERSTKKSDHLLGMLLCSFSVVMMLTGGWPAFTYFTIIYATLYGVLNLPGNWKDIKNSLIYIILAVILTCALLSLPLSESIVSIFSGESMGSYRENPVLYPGGFDPFEKTLYSNRSPISLFLANALYLSFNPGWGQMYMSAIIAVTLIAGLFISFSLKKADIIMLGLAILNIMSSGHRHSFIAVLCVKYLPGFGMVQFRSVMGALSIFFLITVSLRRLELLKFHFIFKPHLRLRFAISAIVTIITVNICAAYFVEDYSDTWPYYIDVMTSYYFGFMSIFSILALFCILVILFIIKKTSKDSICVYSLGFLSLFFIVGHHMFLIIMKILNLPSDYIMKNYSHLLSIQSKSIIWIWKMDIYHSAVFLAAFLLLILFFYDVKTYKPKWVWIFPVLIFFDMSYASKQYEGIYDNNILINNRPGQRIEDSYPQYNFQESFHIIGNDRNPHISYKAPPHWTGVNSNAAYIIKKPTYWSGTPWIDMRTANLMTTNDNYKIFSKLIWFFPEDKTVSLENWYQYADTTGIKNILLKPNRMSVTVTARKPGLLIWTDSWNPGWRATVNGESVPVEKVFDTIKAVTVPSGKSHVVFTYRLKYFYLGIISLAAGFIFIGFSINKIRQYKKRELFNNV